MGGMFQYTTSDMEVTYRNGWRISNLAVRIWQDIDCRAKSKYGQC